jgi:MBG domain (YGX type)
VLGGPYHITATLGPAGVLSNYSITNTGASFTINPALLTITAKPKSRLYGVPNPTLDATNVTLVAGDTPLSIGESCTTAAVTNSPVGMYAINCTATSTNYTITPVAGTLTITQAPLVITANSTSRPYGDPNPAVGFMTSPAVLIDTNSLGLSGVTCSSSAGPTTAVGVYPTANNCSGGSDSNYSISYAAGTLTINLRLTTITYTGPTSSTYGDCAFTVSGVLTDVDLVKGIPGQLVTFTIGTQSVTATTDANGLASAIISLNQNANKISASASYGGSLIYAGSTSGLSNNFTISADPGVGPLNGQTMYTGSQIFWTANSTSSTATLTLAATVVDTGRTGTGGSCHGDIRTAKLTFAYRATGGASWTPIPSAQNLPVGLIDPTNPTVGSASAITQFNLGNANFAQFQVAVILAGNYYYNNPADDAIVTVGVPGVANTIMAGGDIDLHAFSTYPASSGYLTIPAGLIAGKEGYLNVSGTVSYLKNGKSLTNPQGSIWLKFTTMNRPDGTLDSTPHVYFIKTSSIASLNSPVTGTYSFTAKSQVEDVTTGTTLDGNATLQLTVNDVNGTASVSVQGSKSGGTMWITSAWNSTTTVVKPVTNGAIVGN